MIALWIALGVSLVVGLIGLLIYLGVRSSRKQKEALARLGEAVGGLEPDQMKDVEEGGIVYSFGYFSAKNKQPAYLQIQVECPAETTFRIRRENWYDRLGQ